MKFWGKRKVVLLLAAAGLAALLLIPRGKEEKFRTVKVERKDVAQTLSISGVVGAEKKASLTFLSPGKLAFVRVKVGDRVRRGEWLAGLDTGDLAAAERGAYYAYLAADANAKAVEDNLKGKDATETFEEKSRRVAAQTARDRAYDAWLTAKRAVDNAVLKAPFDGVVTEVTVAASGDIVGLTDGVTVVDPETVWFETQVNEQDIAKVFLGQEVKVKLDAYPELELVGKVARMGYSAKIGSTGATVLPVWVALPAEKRELYRQGLNGEAVIELKRKKGVLAVPFEAVKDGKVKMADGKTREVKVGLEGDLELEILEGLAEGEAVRIE